MQYGESSYRKSPYSGHVMTTYIDTGETRQDGCEGVGKVMVKVTTSKDSRVGITTTAQQCVVYPSGSEQTMIFGNGYCVIGQQAAKMVTEKAVRTQHETVLKGMTAEEVVAKVYEKLERKAA